MNIKKLIELYFPPQYVYSYPTTRLYKPVNYFSYDEVDFGNEINIYIHIPFCDQKCSFCGYLTTIETQDHERELYVNAIVKEILLFAPYVQNKNVRSINFGGGTPMLLSELQIQKIIDALHTTFSDFLKTTTEISIEATPESITDAKVSFLALLGFNRISIGIQTLDSLEIKHTKRHNFSEQSIKAIEIVKNSKIQNLCVDVMYGLPLQTKQSWIATLNGVLIYRPETVELYRMVVVPKTGVSKYIDPSMVPAWRQKYELYEIAKQLLIAAGYVQESHVRFVIPGKGFYVQQVNVFKGESLIGFGVGARTYSQYIYYRNIYSNAHSKNAVRRYINALDSNDRIVESSIHLSADELERRYIIYNLDKLDINLISEKYHFNFSERYLKLLEIFMDTGLYTKAGDSFELTETGMYHRDLIAYSFFSKQNMELEKQYYGEFLKDW